MEGTRSWMKNVKENVGKVLVGKEDVIDLILTALIAGGHVLLEDVPGTGKTMLAKSLAKSLETSFTTFFLSLVLFFLICLSILSETLSIEAYKSL